MSNKTTYITKSKLKSTYKLSESWIKRLGTPDKLAPNPIYSSASKMRLYDETRVLKFLAQNAEEYYKWLEKRERLSAAQKKRCDKARDETTEWAKTVQISMKKIPINLMAATRSYFVKRSFELGRYEDGSGDVNLAGVLAYLRHGKTNYDELLHELFGRIGTLEAYRIIKDRVTKISIAAILKKEGKGFFDERLKEFQKRYPNLAGLVDEYLTDDEKWSEFLAGKVNISYGGNELRVLVEAFRVLQTLEKSEKDVPT